MSPISWAWNVQRDKEKKPQKIAENVWWDITVQDNEKYKIINKGCTKELRKEDTEHINKFRGSYFSFTRDMPAMFCMYAMFVCLYELGFAQCCTSCNSWITRSTLPATGSVRPQTKAAIVVLPFPQ